MKVIKTKFNRSQFCAARICLFAVLVGIWAAGKFNVPAADSLEKGFLSPPAAAKPQVWWQWMNGHITREGITRDLEAMKAAGLGGFTLFNTSEGTPAAGPVAYMSGEWWKLFQHTLAEAGRLGLEMGLQNSAGWSASGGPWVTPDRAMQEVVWTEKRVTGPAGFDGVLEIPEPALGIERDMKRNAEINKRYYVPRERVRGYYRDIALWAFPTPKSDQGPKPFRLDDWKAKAGFSKLKGDYAADSRPAAAADSVDPKQMVELTSKLGPDGRLQWQVPPGDWTLLRFGYQPTGRQNHPAPPSGRGLEIDKLSATAVDFYWQNSVAMAVDLAVKTGNQSFRSVNIDSYEAGHQNWNVTFADNFRRRRGYDVVRYLPALTGRVVGNVDTTEKFLWDFRKTLSDLMGENYYGRFARLCARSGLALAVEPYGVFGNTDDHAIAGIPEIPTAEFWSFGDAANRYTAKLAASGAHTQGRTLVGAEAFTGRPDRIFEEHPYALKAEGDYFFCQGINRFNLHVFMHNPYHAVPGFGLGCYGTRFDSGNTWWPFAPAWFDYLGRCQYLLQQGRFVADLLYFTGEDDLEFGKGRRGLQPPPPAGFDFDYCNRAALDQLTVQAGRLMLSNGVSYRVLVLPPTQNMRPEVLRKIESLVAAGATVVGPKPLRVPGLEGGSAAEVQLLEIADQLWGDCDGQSVKISAHGKGWIYWGQSLAAVCDDLKLEPDFTFQVRGKMPMGATLFPGNGVEFIHRRTGATDLYFVSNQHEQPKTIEAAFRIRDRLPELWHPDSGRTEVAPQFRTTADGRTVVTLKLDPAGSVFVVFRRPMAAAIGITAVEQNGRAADVSLRREDGRLFLASQAAGEFSLKTTRGDFRRVSIPEVSAPMELTGPWQVAFPSGWGAPEKVGLPTLASWSQHTNLGVKYFSGTAAYHLEVDVPPERLAKGRRVTLDLGDVQVVAEVLLNGRSAGVLWKAPYAVEVTHLLRAGRNQLEIRVANLWVNRLIGDGPYPDDVEWTTNTGSTATGLGLTRIPDWVVNHTPRPSPQRKAFVSWRWPHLAKKELLPSGLIGPVRLVSEIEAEVKNTLPHDPAGLRNVNLKTK